MYYTNILINYKYHPLTTTIKPNNRSFFIKAIEFSHLANRTRFNLFHLSIHFIYYDI